MTLRAVVVDDEPLARQRVLDLLAAEPDVEVVAACADGEAAIEAVERLRPDLLFLDVQMPETSGFDVLEALGPGTVPVVIFVTAHDEYALRAFDAHALDYLLKPFHRARFQAALARTRTVLAGRAAAPEAWEERLRRVLDEVRPSPRHPRRLVVRLGARILFVATDDVDWIDAEGNYARLHVGERSYLLRETMARLEERLDPERFLRIHRSTIVAVDRIREVQPMFKGSYVVILRDGTRLTSTRGYRDRLQALIEGGA